MIWHQSQEWDRQAPSVALELTQRCDLRCTHCYISANDCDIADMPFELIRSLTEELREWKCPGVRLTGGEPTLHPRFREIVAVLYGAGLHVGLNTNGCVSGDTLSFLRRSTINEYLISIDGLKRKNDELRGEGVFSKAIEASRELASSGKRVIVSFHVHSGNWRDIDGMIDLCVKNDLNLKASPVRLTGRASSNKAVSLATAQQFRYVVEAISKARCDASLPIRLTTDFDILSPVKAPGCVPICRAGRTMVTVACDGSIYPCAHLREDADCAPEKAGASSLRETWGRPDTFRAVRSADRNACIACDCLAKNCSGGCLAMVRAADGGFQGPDPICFKQQ